MNTSITLLDNIFLALHDHLLIMHDDPEQRGLLLLIVVGLVSAVVATITILLNCLFKFLKYKWLKREPKTMLREAEKLYKYLMDEGCPDCKAHDHFLAGPEAGMATNIKCNCCGSKFNVVPAIQWAERISKRRTQNQKPPSFD